MHWKLKIFLLVIMMCLAAIIYEGRESLIREIGKAMQQKNVKPPAASTIEGEEPILDMHDSRIELEPIYELQNGAQQHNIEIRNMAFSTTSIKIKEGDTVAWINYDSQPHRIISKRASFLQSEKLLHNDSYGFEFKEKGEFDFYCELHPDMKGIVIVQ